MVSTNFTEKWPVAMACLARMHPSVTQRPVVAHRRSDVILMQLRKQKLLLGTRLLMNNTLWLELALSSYSRVTTARSFCHFFAEVFGHTGGALVMGNCSSLSQAKHFSVLYLSETFVANSSIAVVEAIGG